MTEDVFAAEGLVASTWSNAAGAAYAWHEHPRSKLLVCVEGSIVFHTHEGDIALRAGDRLDLPAGTPHAATVGPGGVVCREAMRD